MINDNKNLMVVQSNPLIEGQYKLDVLPQKIIRHLVSLIKPAHATFENRVYRLSVGDFAAMIGRGYSGQVVKDIQAASEKLLMTKLTIKQGKLTTQATWIASFKHHVDEGWFEYSFAVHLETELLQIKEKFTQYQLVNIARLKSQYSIRIYELLRQYMSIGVRSIMVDELKTMLGIEKNEYEMFGNFKLKVLNPAYREIREKTDIDYRWSPIREGRKTVGVKFYDIQANVSVPRDVVDLLPSEQQSNKDVLRMLRRWIGVKSEDYVKSKIQYICSRKYENFGDYLFSALENNYGEDHVPREAEGPGDGVKAGPVVRDGMKIEIEGVVYVVEDGHIFVNNGVMPRNDIVKCLVSGRCKEVIDV